LFSSFIFWWFFTDNQKTENILMLWMGCGFSIFWVVFVADLCQFRLGEVEDATSTATTPPTSPSKLPVCVVVGSPPERVAVRLRHTFSLGLSDRVKLRSSNGSPTSSSSTTTADELAAKFSSSSHPFSPESVRKRFSIGSSGSGSSSKRSSSTLKLDSPSESHEEHQQQRRLTIESPAINVTTPSGEIRKELFPYPDRVPHSDARCRPFQEDTDSLQSGQNTHTEQ
jgi:hypothetical protein